MKSVGWHLCDTSNLMSTAVDDAGILNGLQAVESLNTFFNHPKGVVLGVAMRSE